MPLSEQHGTGHHWSLMLATELSEVFAMTVTGAGAITGGQQGRESKLGNQLRTAQLNTRPRHGTVHGRVWLMKDGDLFQVIPFTVGLQKRASYLFNEIEN